MKRILVTAALLAGIMTYAGGFRVSLQGVKQLAMAHTSAHADDASVAFFNPAGISFIPNKLSIAAGGFGVKSEVEYQNLSTMYSAKTQSPMGTPVYAAVAYKVLENVSVGFSFATPYGSTIEWPEDWAGRDMIQRMELKAMYFQPMISVKLAPWVSVGGSYIYAKGIVDQTRALTQFGGTLNIKDDKAKGSGLGLGFYFRPSDKMDISVAYRSQVDMKAENGVATFNVPQSLINLGYIPSTDKFTATLPLVEEYTVGATYKVTPKWSLSGDINIQGWENYKTLVIDFEKANVGSAPDPTKSISPRDFKNSYTYRVGTQYMIKDNLAGRLGYYYDQSPYEDRRFIADTPSFNAHVITGGLGYKWGGLGIDLAAAYTMTEARDVKNSFYNFYGQAKAKVFTFGLGLSYNAF